jgi:hypothetical protein
MVRRAHHDPPHKFVSELDYGKERGVILSLLKGARKGPCTMVRRAHHDHMLFVTADLITPCDNPYSSTHALSTYLKFPGKPQLKLFKKLEKAGQELAENTRKHLK